MSKKNPKGQAFFEDKIPIVGKKEIGKGELRYSTYTFKAVYSLLSD